MQCIFNEIFQIKYPHKMTLLASFLKDIISEIFLSIGWFLDSFHCTYTSALQNSIRKTRKVKFVEVPASAVSQYFGMDLISSAYPCCPHRSLHGVAGFESSLKSLYWKKLASSKKSKLATYGAI